MNNEKGIIYADQRTTHWGRFLRLALIILIIISLFLLVGIRAFKDYHSRAVAPQTALDYYNQERDFINQYARDYQNGGFYYWVNSDGSIKDSKKMSLFQANIILWAGGLESQSPDPKNIEIVKSAADYLIRYLYRGNGEWYEYDSVDHITKQDFYWNPRSEGYISFGLFQAYRLTKTRRYLQLAIETNKALRIKNPDGRIFADWDRSKDIGFRFPEHMAQYEEYKLTNNLEALDYARSIDRTYKENFAKEYLTPEQGGGSYYHGTAVLDNLLFSFVDKNPQTFAIAEQGREYYWNAPHNDSMKFNTEIPGESADNGRDYYDKRMAMDLISWSQTSLIDFQEDARDMWNELKRFWDYSKPYGFFINQERDRKTCFSIGIPQFLMDLTAPKVIAYTNKSLPFFNHQVELVMSDDQYMWNDIELKGIGLDAPTVKIKTPIGSQYGEIEKIAGPCDGCMTYRFNYFSFWPSSLKIGSYDYFSNFEYRSEKNPFSPFAYEAKLNIRSLWFYAIVTLIGGISIISYLFLYIILPRRHLRRHKKK